jgi:hypothetical protein
MECRKNVQRHSVEQQKLQLMGKGVKRQSRDVSACKVHKWGSWRSGEAHSQVVHWGKREQQMRDASRESAPALT